MNKASRLIRSALKITFLFIICSCSHSEKNASVNTPSSDKPITDTSAITPGSNQANVVQSANLIQPNQLIIPGKSIGQTTLNMTAEEVNTLLGQGDQSDAAMGKAWVVWYSKLTAHDTVRKETIIYFVTNMGNNPASRVKQIRVTSSFFKTADKLGVGSSLNDIQMKYPRLEKAKVNEYLSAQTKQPTTILDAQATGIAFEFNPENTCVAVVVHEPQQPVNTTYLHLFQNE